MSFEDIEFSKELKQSIKRMKYDKATDVQVDTIPLILEGHNVIVQSHTGSGKTAAFGIPVSEQIFTRKIKSALILCPTRELAVQVKEELKKINSDTRLRISAFYGGHGMTSEYKAIDQGIDILCATPGRLLDHFRRGNLKASHFEVVILDEADRMLDMGFISDIREILSQVKPVNTHLFSATLDGSVARLIQEYIPTYEEIILPEEIIGKNIFERHIKVSMDDKIHALVEILEEAKDGRVLIFVSTKRSVDFLARKLHKMDFGVESLHGDKTQRSREMALQNFKSGKRKILVATDVAARGLQIDNIEYVVNYDLAGDADTHKHRIGRTGRMGDKGHAISFVGEDGNVIDTKRMHFGRRGGGQKRGFRANQKSQRGNQRGNQRNRQGGQRSSYGGQRSHSGSGQGGSRNYSGSSHGDSSRSRSGSSQGDYSRSGSGSNYSGSSSNRSSSNQGSSQRSRSGGSQDGSRSHSGSSQGSSHRSHSGKPQRPRSRTHGKKGYNKPRSKSY